MEVASRPSDRQVAELLERLATSRDGTEACSIVLDRAVAEGGLRRAVVVLWDGSEMHGAGWGVEENRLQAFLRLATSEESRLKQILVAGTPPAEEDTGILGDIGFERVRCFPIPDPVGARAGALFLDVDAENAAVGFALELFARSGASIFRALEVEIARRRMQRLDQQRDILTSIFNGLPDPVLLTDSENDILLANSRAESLFSTSEGDSEGRRRAVQINNLLITSFLTQGVIGTRVPDARELNLVDPSDGSDLLFEVLSSVSPGATRGEPQVLSILRDITDLKRAVAELEAQFGRSRGAEHRARRERDRLNAILENVSDPILVTDDQSDLILMNREAERLFVVPGGPDRDSPKRRAVRANDTKFTTLISDFLLRHEVRRVAPVELSDPDSGRGFAAEAVSSKVLNDRGEPTAIVTTIHDLTQVVENQRLARELKELNDQLEERIRRATAELEERNQRLEWQSRKLEEASRLKTEFLANMSHELRTPINALLGYTALMQERIYGDLTGHQETALEKIRSATRHLLELINDILDLSKIEAGKMQVHLEEVSVQQVARELAETLQPLVERKNLAYRLQLEEGIPPLRTDRTKVKQILLNLLSNAVKFTPDGEVTLRILVPEDDSHLRMEVSDTGIGIEPEQLGAIFEEFRQIDGSHTREHGGTGLGLSITKKLVTLLGGTIDVASAPGRGTTFTVDLPVDPVLAPELQRASDTGT